MKNIGVGRIYDARLGAVAVDGPDERLTFPVEYKAGAFNVGTGTVTAFGECIALIYALGGALRFATITGWFHPSHSFFRSTPDSSEATRKRQWQPKVCRPGWHR